MPAFVTFGYTNLFDSTRGLDAGELEELRPRLEEAARDLRENPPGFMRLPKTSEFLDSLKALAEEVRTSGATDFVHVGIGDSALGPIALYRALSHPYYNLLPERLGPRLHFAENTDPTSLSAILDVVDPSNTWGKRCHQERLDRRDYGELPRRPQRSHGNSRRKLLQRACRLYYRPRKGLPETDS